MKRVGRRFAIAVSTVLLAAGALSAMNGCAGAKLIGAMAQNYEYQKQIEVLPEYTGLENRTVAVIVDADYSTLFQHPHLVANVMGGVAGRIRANVPGARVLDPRMVYAWQYNTPSWNAMPYGEIADQLNVERVVYVDIYEFRLNPPGNRWEWEGMLAANVGIIERGGFAPDTFASSHHVSAKFPTVRGVGRDDASPDQIETGLLAEFIKQTGWLFHEHLRPKYPDKFRAAR